MAPPKPRERELGTCFRQVVETGQALRTRVAIKRYENQQADIRGIKMAHMKHSDTGRARLKSKSNNPNGRPQEWVRTGPAYMLASWLNDNIDHLLDAAGLTKRQAATELEYAQPNIFSMWRTGRARIPLYRLPALAKMLGVELRFLLGMWIEQYGGEPDPNDKSVVRYTQDFQEILEVFELLPSASEMDLIRAIREARATNATADLSDEAIIDIMRKLPESRVGSSSSTHTTQKPSGYDDNAVIESSNPKPESATVLVPFDKSDQPFSPSFGRGKSGNVFTVGAKGSEQQIEGFYEALAILEDMEVARWRRPNRTGNWGIVSARHWKEVPVTELLHAA